MTLLRFSPLTSSRHKNGKISVQSPVGRALIGKRVGDTLEVQTPAKVAEYEVLNICFEKT